MLELSEVGCKYLASFSEEENRRRRGPFCSSPKILSFLDVETIYDPRNILNTSHIQTLMYAISLTCLSVSLPAVVAAASHYTLGPLINHKPPFFKMEENIYTH